MDLYISSTHMSLPSWGLLLEASRSARLLILKENVSTLLSYDKSFLGPSVVPVPNNSPFLQETS